MRERDGGSAADAQKDVLRLKRRRMRSQQVPDCEHERKHAKKVELELATDAHAEVLRLMRRLHLSTRNTTGYLGVGSGALFGREEGGAAADAGAVHLLDRFRGGTGIC